MNNNSSFETLRDYGISINNYSSNYIFIFSDEEIFTPKIDCNDIKKYRNSIEYIIFKTISGSSSTSFLIIFLAISKAIPIK